jgi:hypothetical protein
VNAYEFILGDKTYIVAENYISLNKIIEEINYTKIEGFWFKVYDNINVFIPIYKLHKI